MDNTIHINDLSQPTLTRRRGHEAYNALKPLLSKSQVKVDLRNVDMISMSFLDGLVANLLDSETAQDVTFVVSDSRVLQKLSRIVAIRNARLYFSASGGRKRRIPALEMDYQEAVQSL